MTEVLKIAEENTKKWRSADKRQRDLKANLRVFRSSRHDPSETFNREGGT